MLVRIAAVLALIGALALPAKADEYPDHAIKMIVPFAAGGGTDVIARIIAQAAKGARLPLSCAEVQRLLSSAPE